LLKTVGQSNSRTFLRTRIVCVITDGKLYHQKDCPNLQPLSSCGLHISRPVTAHGLMDLWLKANYQAASCSSQGPSLACFWLSLLRRVPQHMRCLVRKRPSLVDPCEEERDPPDGRNNSLVLCLFPGNTDSRPLEEQDRSWDGSIDRYSHSLEGPGSSLGQTIEIVQIS